MIFAAAIAGRVSVASVRRRPKPGDANPARDAVMAALYAAEHFPTEIAKVFGCHRDAVRLAVRRMRERAKWPI